MIEDHWIDRVIDRAFLGLIVTVTLLAAGAWAWILWRGARFIFTIFN